MASPSEYNFWGTGGEWAIHARLCPRLRGAESVLQWAALTTTGSMQAQGRATCERAQRMQQQLLWQVSAGARVVQEQRMLVGRIRTASSRKSLKAARREIFDWLRGFTSGKGRNWNSFGSFLQSSGTNVDGTCVRRMTESDVTTNLGVRAHANDRIGAGNVLGTQFAREEKPPAFSRWQWRRARPHSITEMAILDAYRLPQNLLPDAWARRIRWNREGAHREL